MSPTIQQVREQFPSLSSGFAYLENAGGSQVPLCVAEAVKEHMLNDYVQLGAGYSQSVRATQIVAEAHQFAAELLNAGGSGQIVLGASTTSLIHRIAYASGQIWQPGDEIIIAETNHEANAGAWEGLGRQGLVIKIWKFDRASLIGEPSDLEPLLTSRTKLIAMPHVSNIVGSIESVKAASGLAHSVGAQLFVDGVAFAPHHLPDVQELGADWYVCSAYKIYGPHLALLYGRNDILAALEGPNHGFIPNDAYPDKWEPGGISHEACAGLVAAKNYFSFLADGQYSGRATLEAAYALMAALEKPAEIRLRQWLSSRNDLTLIGSGEATAKSVATVSFVHHSLSSSEISQAVDQASLGIRHGNMYAVRLLDGLGVPRYPGVVRVSAVHYNTVEEIERLIAVLDPLFETAC